MCTRLINQRVSIPHALDPYSVRMWRCAGVEEEGWVQSRAQGSEHPNSARLQLHRSCMACVQPGLCRMGEFHVKSNIIFHHSGKTFLEHSIALHRSFFSKLFSHQNGSVQAIHWLHRHTNAQNILKNPFMSSSIWDQTGSTLLCKALVTSYIYNVYDKITNLF